MHIKCIRGKGAQKLSFIIIKQLHPLAEQEVTVTTTVCMYLFIIYLLCMNVFIHPFIVLMYMYNVYVKYICMCAVACM